MKKRIVSLILVCFLIGCGDSVPQSESNEDTYAIQMESQNEEADADGIQTEPQSEAADVPDMETGEGASTEPESPEEEFVWFIGPNKNIDFEYAYGEYDYVFYLESISLSSDGQPGQICINPVEFVWNWETQRWLDWGNREDEGPYCDVRDEDPNDTLILPLKQTTEFHFCNGVDDSTLYELSDRYKGRECVTTDPEVFLLYIHQQFTNDAEDYPFFLLLDQEGAVQYIIDAGLV